MSPFLYIQHRSESLNGSEKQISRMINKFIMVDVLIRNMDPKIWAQIKADAAAHQRSLAEEVKEAFVSHQMKKGTGRDLLKLPQWSGKNEKTRNASQRVDALFDEAVMDDYRRQQRAHRTRTKG